MTNQYPGVYATKRKDNTPSFRASITWNGKHISLGSYEKEEMAGQAYLMAKRLMNKETIRVEDYRKSMALSFDKWVMLVNLKENGIYISNPIVIHKRYFSYYLTKHQELKFDIDDLFYFTSHKIMKRAGHLFVSDYGMQVSLLSRYGIFPYAKAGIDYQFANGDVNDYRYENLIIINPYFGVHQIKNGDRIVYRAKIHVNGSVIIGDYLECNEAAIAYNKAADILKKRGFQKEYIQNFLEGISPSQYADIYTKVKIRDVIYKMKLPEMEKKKELVCIEE